MIRRILLLLGIALLAAPAFAQEATGDWAGTLEVNAQTKLRLAVHVRQTPEGKLQGTMDSLDQGATGIPLGDIVATPGKLGFTVPMVGGNYEASWDAGAKRWRGIWSQGGMRWPLELEAAAPAPPPPPIPAVWDIPADEAIGKTLDARLAARPGVSIVVGVIEPAGRRVVARGPGEGLGGKTLFEIGSMTKVFTSLLLADMAAKGEVKLDDPAEKYLPAGAAMPERGRKITLADLATHRSGLPRLPGNLAVVNLEDPYADYTEAQLLAFLAGHRLVRGVGEQYEYSNLGMGLLGYLLARRAGTDYATLVQRRITGPLGMKDTVIAPDAGQQARFIGGHDAQLRPAKPWNLPALAGAGALRSTADDILRFLDAAMGTRPTPLAPAFAAMLAQRWEGPSGDVATGLGWMVTKGRGIVFHEGGTGGFRTTMAYDPEKKRGVVVLTNAAAEPSSGDLAFHLLIGAPVAPAR